MKILITDSSVIVKWLNEEGEEDLFQADQILKDVQESQVKIKAPELAKYEVGNALLKKGLVPTLAYQSLGTIYSLPIEFVSETEDLAIETYKMAYEARAKGDKNFTYYDAAFTALAKQENAVLVTANPKHQKKITGVKVLSLKDYK